jgi:zinc protease
METTLTALNALGSSKRPRTAAVFLLAAAISTGPVLAQTPWPSEGPPRPLASRSVSFPDYEVRTLDNGLQVVAVLHHEQPVVSMRMLVRAGASLDPRGKAGLADLAASLLDQGTTSMSSNEMNDAIDFTGGVMGAGAGSDLTFVNLVVMKDSFEFGLRMLSDMARRPAFAPEEIDRKRRQTLSALQVSFEDPEYVADAVFNRLVYGSNPYGMPQSGTPETLTSITRDDLVAYHERNFVPNNAILAIVGDVTADEAFDGVRKVFGDWQRRDVTRPAFIAPPDPARRVVVVNKADAVQTEIRVGHVGVRRNNPDYMPLNLTLRILGGEGANRLHQVLRTERGLTYGAKADLDTMLESGDFEASTNTRSEATGEVLRLMVDEFWRLQRERVGERELSSAKAYITGSFPLTIETPDAIAAQVLNVLFYGLPSDHLQTYRDRVNAVRSDDIERVSRSFLRPDRLSVVLVGNAKAFSSQLRGLGFQNFDVVEMTDLDLLAVDFRRAGARPGASSGGGGGAPPPVSRSPAYRSVEAQSPQHRVAPSAAAARAKALVSEMIEAKGGLDRLSAIKNITAATRTTGTGANGAPATVETLTYLEYPDHVRVESRDARGEMIQVYDGSRAWVLDPRGARDGPSTMVRDLQASLKRDTVAALLAAQDGRLRVRLLLDAKDDTGAACRAVEFSGPALDPLIMCVDPVTRLVLKQTYVAGVHGQPLVEEIFGDYRSVNDVQIAFTTRVRIRGELVLERVVTSFSINAPLPAALFKRPVS